MIHSAAAIVPYSDITGGNETKQEDRNTCWQSNNEYKAKLRKKKKKVTSGSTADWKVEEEGKYKKAEQNVLIYTGEVVINLMCN